MLRDLDLHLDLATGGASPEPEPDPRPDDGPPYRWCVREHLGCPSIDVEYIEVEGDEDGPF